MAKFCLHCGKKNNPFTGDPLELLDDKILCAKCAKTLDDQVQEIWRVKTAKEFELQKERVLTEARKQFPEKIVLEIERKIDSMLRNISPEVREQKEKQYVNELNKALEQHLLTTGYNFEGYKITKYIDVISSEIIISTGPLSEIISTEADYLGINSPAFTKKLQQAKKIVQKKLVAQSVSLGGNGIIGIKFDHVTFRSNMLGVIVNGTCVQVEKIED